MRFTIVGPAYPSRGGIAHHVFWLGRELREKGHSTQIISYRRLYPSFLFPGKTTIDPSRLRLDPEAQAILDPLKPATWFRACQKARRFEPHAVVIEWWNPFFSPCLGTLIRLCEAAGLRCIVECHNILPHERSLADFALLYYVLSPARFFITHSQQDRNQLESIVGDRCVMVAALPTIRELASASDRARGGRALLFFGIVRKYKGLEVLLRALPKVLSETDCHLVVAGEFYEPVDPYQQLIRSLGIEAHVRIDNRYIPNEEVPRILENADVLVLPYLSATQSGVARVAQASALPIIASRTGGLVETIIDGQTGLLFPPGDSDALADCIIKYFRDGLGREFAAALRLSEMSERSDLVAMFEAMATGAA